MTKAIRSLTLGAIALLLAACIPPYEGPEGGDRVGVMGDSITRVSEGAINHVLKSNGYRMSLLTEDSALVHDMQNWAGAYADSEPDVMVINLGANNGLGSASQAIGELEIMWDKFPASTCLVPVTLAQDTGLASYDDTTAEINDWIYANFPDENIADWAAIYASGDFTTNPLHPNVQGRNHLAQAILRAVNAC